MVVARRAAAYRTRDPATLQFLFEPPSDDALIRVTKAASWGTMLLRCSAFKKTREYHDLDRDPPGNLAAGDVFPIGRRWSQRGEEQGRSPEVSGRLRHGKPR